MAGYLCCSLAILVFWGLAHFQDAAVLMADRPLTYLQVEPFTDVNIGETHSLQHEKDPKESRLKRQAGENNKCINIMETLTSQVNALKKQMDQRVKADDEQGCVSNSLRNDLAELEGRAERQEKAIGRLRDELTSNITSLQDWLELHVIEYKNLTSQVFRLISQSEMVHGLTSDMAEIDGRLVDQEQMGDQHSANISHIETELEKVTKADENITSDINDLREEFASMTAEVRNNLTLAVGSLEERLDLKENTDGILATIVTSLLERIKLQEHTEGQLTSYLTRLQVRLNSQEYDNTNLASNLSSMQRKIDQQEDTDTRLISNLTRLQKRLNHQENTVTLITSNFTSLHSILASYLTGLQEKLTSDIASLLTRLERLEPKEAEAKLASGTKRVEDKTAIHLDGPVLIFRAMAGVNVSAYDTYVNKSRNGGGDQALTTDCLSADDPNLPPNAHYRCGLLDKWSSLSIDMVRVSVYKEKEEVAFVTFNGTGSTYLNWFSPDRVINSSWTEVIPQSRYSTVFSIEGQRHGFLRRFYIPYSHDTGCAIVAGWLMVVEVPAGVSACTWETGEWYPRMYYSKLSSYATWTSVSDVGMADMLTVSVTLRKDEN